MSEEKKPDIEFLTLQVEVWRESIASTKHFTEMSVKMRQLGLTFVAAALALAITLLSQSPTARLSILIKSSYYDIHLSGFVIIIAAVGLYVTKQLDLKLYHKMLRGSVAFTEELERASLVPFLMGTKRGLAEAISLYSRTKQVVPDASDRSLKRTTAESKIRAFYNLSMIFTVLIGGLVTVFTTNIVERHSTIIDQRIEINEAPDSPRKPQKKIVGPYSQSLK